MLIKRRKFLQTGSLATASLMLPRFLKAMEKPRVAGPGNKVLVVLQMSGGNDGLNTVIPVRNDIYYRERPHLGIARESALTLTSETSIHPALPAFKELYDQGHLGILHGVGYPNPDRSHFRSMDIWQSGSSAREYLYTGWLGRYLDAQCSGCDKPTQALEIDDTLSLALKGERIKGISLRDPARLYRMSSDGFLQDLSAGNKPYGADQPSAYLYKVMAETMSGAKYIYDQSRSHANRGSYPKTELGKNLQLIASLILSDINTRVYYVSVGSFDTHVAQQATQQRLFAEVNEAMKAFVDDLAANHRLDDLLLMSFSEFGRRVSQNASGGTDHGSANCMFLIGGGLRQKGLINAAPDLTALPDGDLPAQVDFRDVYATVLRKWLDADDKSIMGRPAAYLDFI